MIWMHRHQKLASRHHWSLGMDKQFHPTVYSGCNYLSMLGLKLNHVSKRGPGHWIGIDFLPLACGTITAVSYADSGWLLYPEPYCNALSRKYVPYESCIMHPMGYAQFCCVLLCFFCFYLLVDSCHLFISHTLVNRLLIGSYWWN